MAGAVRGEVSDLEQLIAQGMLLAKCVEAVSVRREAAAIGQSEKNNMRAYARWVGASSSYDGPSS
jgi:hypothetical protein